MHNTMVFGVHRDRRPRCIIALDETATAMRLKQKNLVLLLGELPVLLFFEKLAPVPVSFVSLSTTLLLLLQHTLGRDVAKLLPWGGVNSEENARHNNNKKERKRKKLLAVERR